MHGKLRQHNWAAAADSGSRIRNVPAENCHGRIWSPEFAFRNKSRSIIFVLTQSLRSIVTTGAYSSLRSDRQSRLDQEMMQNPTRIDRKKQDMGMNLRSHSIDKLNHYDRRMTPPS
jgi:hypothetical protein